MSAWPGWLRKRIHRSRDPVVRSRLGSSPTWRVRVVGSERRLARSAALVGGAIGPKRTPRLPVRAQAVVVRHRVLNDKRLDTLRMRQRHAKTYRAAVVLHVQRVAREAERLGEVIHDLGDVVKRVCKVFGSGQSLCPKPG